MEFRKLLEPEKIGGMHLKNRMIMPPMATGYAGESGEVTDRIIHYYSARAQGGVGLIVVEGASPQPGGHPRRLAIYNDQFILGLKRLTDAIHKFGCKVAIQINPNRGRLDEVRPVCASDVPSSMGKAKVLSTEEIEHVIEGFGDAVIRAREAGFDSVMIHGAGPYIVMDFLSPSTNKRRDEYGGDIRGRARFPIELLRAAKKAGEDYPIIFRLAVDERMEGGMSLSDALSVCLLLEEGGADAIDVVSGGQLWSIPPMGIPPGCNINHAAILKGALNIPIMVAGKILEPYLAEQILVRGNADFVDLGRALIADPEFPEKLMQGAPEEIRKCVCCLRCIDDLLVKKIPVRCSVNALAGREENSRITPTGSPKKILVVGGGPAGMEAARVAALQGHHVSLWKNRVSWAAC